MADSTNGGTRQGAPRLAVIGAGQRAQIALHAQNPNGQNPDAQIPNAENPNAVAQGVRVVAAVDTTEAGRARARALPGSDAAIYGTVDELIAAGGIDAAFVTTPDASHARIAIDLMRAGIAVYLEKPMATTVEDCDAMIRVAEETGVLLYVGHNFRHAAVVALMREIVERGEIGEVKAVWCRHFVGNGGDYYFKDWHADRSQTTSLLLQKASHDIDVIHYLAAGYTRRVTAMGALALYGSITDRRDRSGESMPDWFSMDNWPPRSLTGLNPVVDVEDISMMLMELDNGVLASYQQCHFTPDYWRNYTVIGTEGRLENFGDTAGGVVRVWNRRHGYAAEGDAEYPIEGVESGHDDADRLTVADFLARLRAGRDGHGGADDALLAARNAVAAGVVATESLRTGSGGLDVPPLDLARVGTP